LPIELLKKSKGLFQQWDLSPLRARIARQRRAISACQKVPLGFFAKLLSELQNQFLYHDFAILPLRRVI